MNFSTAQAEDLAEILRLFRAATTRMDAHGVYQWDEIYPNLQVIEDDARSGSLFVIRKEDLCIASVCLNDVQPDQYRPLPWRCENGRALVIHRLCVRPEFQECGAGRCLMDFTETFAKEHSFSCIRLDAHTGNPRALALYEKRGYQRIGQAFFPRRELPFDCFEKILA